MLGRGFGVLPAKVKKDFSYRYCYSAALNSAFITVFDYEIKQNKIKKDSECYM